MNWSYYNKAKYRDIQNISAFCRKYGLGRGNSFFLTLTFKENIIDKKESSSILNSLLTEIRTYYKDFSYISVAERQKRGSWHYHLLCHSKFVTMKSFKRFLFNCISNSSKPFGFFKCNWTYAENVDKLSNYVGKYLCKLDEREKGVRYVSYSRNFNRVCRLPFAWVTGFNRDNWRKPLKELEKIYGFLLREFCKNNKIDRIFSLINEYKTISFESFLYQNTLTDYYKNSPRFYQILLNYSFADKCGDVALSDFFSYNGYSEKEKYKQYLLKMEIA